MIMKTKEELERKLKKLEESREELELSENGCGYLDGEDK